MPLFMDGGWGSLACLCSWMVVGDHLHASVHGWWLGITCMPLFMDGGWGSLACLCSWMVVTRLLACSKQGEEIGLSVSSFMTLL